MSHLERVEKQWTTLGAADPLWAILSIPGKKGGKWDKRAFFETGVVEIEGVIKAAEAINQIRFRTAVDFGCGVGRLSQALANHFERVIGIDVADSMIRAARKLNRFPEQCEYRHNVASDLRSLGDESTDFVYSSMTLQHLPHELARLYIQEFFRISRPGAHVIFQLPSKPRSQIWHLIKGALPVALTNWLWRLRSGSPEAMESYSMPENEVNKIVMQAHGSVELIEPDQSGPPGWQSRTYYCTKRPSI